MMGKEMNNTSELVLVKTKEDTNENEEKKEGNDDGKTGDNENQKENNFFENS
jgi:hypothetical protein